MTISNRDNESALDIALRRGDITLIRILEREARRRGLLPSTFRQRIAEHPVRSLILLRIYSGFRTSLKKVGKDTPCINCVLR